MSKGIHQGRKGSRENGLVKNCAESTDEEDDDHQLPVIGAAVDVKGSLFSVIHR